MPQQPDTIGPQLRHELDALLAAAGEMDVMLVVRDKAGHLQFCFSRGTEPWRQVSRTPAVLAERLFRRAFTGRG